MSRIVGHDDEGRGSEQTLPPRLDAGDAADRGKLEARSAAFEDALTPDNPFGIDNDFGERGFDEGQNRARHDGNRL